jgi:hypothetical protein
MFFALFLISVFLRGAAWYAVFGVMICLALSFLYYCCWYVPAAVSTSRGLGLNITVLLPLNPLWARLLIERNIQGGFSKAFEVHVKSEKRELGQYLQLFTADLERAQNGFPGAIFLWESSTPLPLLVRRLIRQGSLDGSAFLEDGGWLVPRFPFTERELKKGRVRRGAIVSKTGTD